MKTILCLIGYLVIQVLPGSFGINEDGFTSMSSSDIIDAAYANGYRQILAAELSPKCKEKALNDLAAAHDSESPMNCNGTVNILKDIGLVLDTAYDSLGRLLSDLNTVINSVPMCWGNEPWYNIPGKIGCIFGQFSSVWNALKDFWNWKSYVMDTVDVIKDMVECIEHQRYNTSVETWTGTNGFRSHISSLFPRRGRSILKVSSRAENPKSGILCLESNDTPNHDPTLWICEDRRTFQPSHLDVHRNALGVLSTGLATRTPPGLATASRTPGTVTLLSRPRSRTASSSAIK